jgi:hypothetical protein
MNVGYLLLFAIFIGGGTGVILGAIMIYLASDELRWKNFLEWVGDRLDNRLTRWLFNTSLGKALNVKTIEAHVRAGKADRARDIAVREGLVEEALEAFSDFGKFREGAILARRMGRDEKADALYRREIDSAQGEGQPVQAAEVAEEAGFWEEAVDRMEKLKGRTTHLRAARLASVHGMPERAVKIFLEEEALVDAMQTAEKHGMLDFVLGYCEKSDSAVLHHFGADAARRSGDAERGIAILEKQGLLHEAALFARESRLDDRADELIEKLKVQKHKNKLKRLGGLPEDPLYGPGRDTPVEDAIRGSAPLHKAIPPPEPPLPDIEAPPGWESSQEKREKVDAKKAPLEEGGPPESETPPEPDGGENEEPLLEG